ncbi:hypothetical protein [Vibrio phage vB_VhaP_PG11]|nr:hypothetical protein [Vibrio phage vB_VhaP_PG11]
MSRLDIFIDLVEGAGHYRAEIYRSVRHIVPPCLGLSQTMVSNALRAYQGVKQLTCPEPVKGT